MKRVDHTKQFDQIRQQERLSRVQRNHLAEWNTKRFEGKKSLNVVLNFRSYLIEQDPTLIRHNKADQGFRPIRQEDVEKTARLFRNKINQFCYGSLYRRSRKKELTITANYQKASVGQKLQHHLHLQVELPEHISEENLRSFIQQFAEHTEWIENQIPYVEATKNNSATQFYNCRYGENTLILF